jgi:hypothetical protein
MPSIIALFGYRHVRGPRGTRLKEEKAVIIYLESNGDKNGYCEDN